MIELIITRYAHFIGVFMIVGAILAEQFIIADTMTRKELKRIAKVDAIYGIGALTVLAAGIILWFWVGKSADFYSRNWVFHTKLTLFILLGIFSIYPTVFFLRNRKGDDHETQICIPKSIKLLLRLELILIIIMPLLATLMSLGIGIF
jgi:putative membrane protein